MKPKEQESQLSLNINLRIFVNILVYLAFIGFIALRLWSANIRPSLLEVSSGISVPELKLENFALLKQSIKIKEPTFESKSVGRAEPFD